MLARTPLGCTGLSLCSNDRRPHKPEDGWRSRLVELCSHGTLLMPPKFSL
jgi:hypothetical protein